MKVIIIYGNDFHVFKAFKMTESISQHQVVIAFAVTLLAGLAIVLGGALVLFFKKPNPRLLSFGLAFSAGAMLYVSLTEILNKLIDSFKTVYTPENAYAFGTFSFLLGVIWVLLLDHFIPNPHEKIEQHVHDPLLNQEQIMRTGMLTLFAINAHNLPEGLAPFFATLSSPSLGTPLAVAIAIHNIPEGFAIGYYVLQPYLGPNVFGIVFGLIGGVMVYLALDELLPTAKRYAQGHEMVYGLVSGMAILASSLVLFKYVI